MNLLFCKTANKSLRLILCSPLIIATRRSNTLWIRKCILGRILIRYCFDFTKYLRCLDLQSSVQVKLCQKLLCLPQLTHNMTKDCWLNYKFSAWKFRAQNMSRTCCVHKLFWASRQKQKKPICVHNMFLTCSELWIFICWTGNTMNNL